MPVAPSRTPHEHDHSESRRLMRALPRLRAIPVALLGLALPVLAQAACQIQTHELPVKMVGSRAVATVGINGTQVPLMVDSGAFYSFLTEAAAAELKLRLKSGPWGMRVDGVTGAVDVRMTTVERLELLKGTLPRVEFLVGGNEPGAGTMGVMGRNLLAATDAEYDLAHGVIRLILPSSDCARANMAYWAGSTPVTEIDLLPDHRSKWPDIRARIKLNGQEITALFDTGATTIVTVRAARRAGVAEADMTPDGTIHGGGQGSARVWTALFDKVDLGGEAVLRNRLPVGDFELGDTEMLMGIDFFLSHRVYVSKAQSKMFVTYNGGPVFALNRRDHASASALRPEPDPAADAPLLSTADQYARRGAASAARQDYVRALADLTRACGLDPDSADFLAQRGAILVALKQPETALADFDQALLLDPALADARLQRASLRLAAANREGAMADLDALDRTLSPQAQMRIALSDLYLTLEQPSRALPQLDQWLAAHEKEARRDVALNGRCWARALLGVDLDKALADCDRAIDVSPNPAYLDSRGWVQLRLGRHKKALADFDASLALRPGSAWSLYGRGLTKLRLGLAPQGEADLAAARLLQPDIDLKVSHVGMAGERSATP